MGPCDYDTPLALSMIGGFVCPSTFCVKLTNQWAVGKSLRTRPSPSSVRKALAMAGKTNSRRLEHQDFLLMLEGFDSDDKDEYRNNSDPVLMLIV